MSATFATADLFDAHGDRCHSCSLQFSSFGGRRTFSGKICTVRCHGDNALVRRALETSTDGGVLVVDGGGSLGTALLGDQLATLGAKNGWSGVLIHGVVRDSVALATIEFGVKALGTNPRKADKRGLGEIDVGVTFGEVTFTPGHWLYSDDDGVLVSAAPLL